MADESADPEKGTGILMVCTFGDAADVEKWRSMGVPAREVIGRDGRIRPAEWGEEPWTTLDAEVAQSYYDKITGQTVAAARREMVSMLTDAGAITGPPETTRRPVKYYEKGDRPLEFVVSRQWFVKVLDKRERLLEQGRKIEWHPHMFLRRYEDWVKGLNQDWCVSRQRYFGVPIPVWYAIDGSGEVDYSRVIKPRKEDLPVDPYAEAPPGFSLDQRGQPGGFVGDPDIFDTWATSSLTPRIPTGWPDEEDRFKTLYPADLRPQSHEIIRTWAFYTITRALLEDASVPWGHVAISGWVVDPDRKKMGKSKGNTVVPTDILDEYGADSVRYWAASARLGVDTAFDPNVFREGKRLATKIRNASRLVLGYEGEGGPATHPLDIALVARLAAVVEQATAKWEAWDHAGALQVTEEWFWSDFTDNYLELSKTRAYDGDASALGTLRLALDVILRLFAPFIVYATEEVWQSVEGRSGSIHRSRWPQRAELAAAEDSGAFDAAVEVMSQIRKAKSEGQVSIKFPVTRLEVRGRRARLDLLETVLGDVRSAGSVETCELIEEDRDDLAASVTLGEAPS
jgi:valyl-tRNA synthetase